MKNLQNLSSAELIAILADFNSANKQITVKAGLITDEERAEAGKVKQYSDNIQRLDTYRKKYTANLAGIILRGKNHEAGDKKILEQQLVELSFETIASVETQQYFESICEGSLEFHFDRTSYKDLPKSAGFADYSLPQLYERFLYESAKLEFAIKSFDKKEEISRKLRAQEAGYTLTDMGRAADNNRRKIEYALKEAIKAETVATAKHIVEVAAKAKAEPHKLVKDIMDSIKAKTIVEVVPEVVPIVTESTEPQAEDAEFEIVESVTAIIVTEPREIENPVVADVVEPQAKKTKKEKKSKVAA